MVVMGLQHIGPWPLFDMEDDEQGRAARRPRPRRGGIPGATRGIRCLQKKGRSQKPLLTGGVMGERAGEESVGMKSSLTGGVMGERAGEESVMVLCVAIDVPLDTCRFKISGLRKIRCVSVAGGAAIAAIQLPREDSRRCLGYARDAAALASGIGHDTLLSDLPEPK